MEKIISSRSNQLNNSNKPKKIRIIQRIFSFALLIILISLTVYYSWPASTEAEITAVKLNVRVHPVSETQISIIVSAVDETGKLDTKRDDEVELSFEGAASSKLEKSRVKLENGEVRVGIQVLMKESSFLNAKWINGPTPLRDGKVLVSPLMWDY